jgi:ribA/ribD-fused uncharacterized protein|uniref:NADAR domain-containing protein n=1 Tax=viral metagenome TaxID=1070528 RepID=A0A6C0DUX6_9ZZZZ
MSAEELKQFYKAKAKKPDLYGYDDSGNLIEINKEGAIIKTIPLPNYRRPTDEEYDEMGKKRMAAIEVANKEYEDARRELRELSANPESIDSDILRVNRKVIEADVKLQAIRFPLKTIEIDDLIPINKIDFDQPNEKRKFPYPFFFLEERPFTLQEQYVRVGKAPEKPLISVAEAKAAEANANAITVILFAEPNTNDYGFLSLKWTVEIEFNGTMYNSAYQAIAAEIAKSFNDKDNLQKIMIAESPDDVNYKLENVPGDAEINETKWNDLTKQLLYDVNIAKYNQYPELAARLLETKNATLGAYIPDDNLIGIGLSIDNIQAKNPVNWTGQNLLGKALMDIRQKIRSEQEAAAAMAVAVAQPAPRRKKQSVTASAATVLSESVTGTEASSEDATMPSGPVPRPPRRRPKPAPTTTAPATTAPATTNPVTTAPVTTNPVATALANVSAVEDMAVAKDIAEGLFI